MISKKTIQALFLFIFIVLGKHISQVLACSINNMINEYFIIKHLIGFFILFTTIISLETTENLKTLFIKSFLLYIWFIITSNTTKYINILIIIILFLTYFIYLYNDRLKKEKHDKKNKTLIKILNLYEKYITYILVILTIIGFIIYLGEKKLEYKENFDLTTFLFYRGQSNLSCSNTKVVGLDNFNYLERIKLAFLNKNKLQQFIETKNNI